MNTNFNLVMNEQITQIASERLAANGESKGKGTLDCKPSLLLHACCAPCSSSVIERLADVFAITLFFYNPNIYPQTEYERRLSELKGFVQNFIQMNDKASASINVVDAFYTPEDFYEQTNVRSEPALQTEREQGERCHRCYMFRMQKAFDYAASNNFDFITTTLSLSPHKDSQKINAIGSSLEAKAKKQGTADIRFLYADFKKQGGATRALELSEQYKLYRQNYCGCEYSLQNKQKK